MPAGEEDSWVEGDSEPIANFTYGSEDSYDSDDSDSESEDDYMDSENYEQPSMLSDRVQPDNYHGEDS
jgi:hypothetical protein